MSRVQTPLPDSPPREGPDTPAPTGTPIHYEVALQSGSEETGDAAVAIVAERDGKTFIAFPPKINPCLSVFGEDDLDRDGLNDALIEDGVCGNCCAPTYYFVPGTTSDRFEAQEIGLGWAKAEMWGARSSLVIETDNEGYNTDRPESITRRFVFEDGRVVKVEEKQAVEEKALVNLRADQFDTAKPDDERHVTFDLDGDGAKDELVGTLWLRWGRIMWQVRFADGRVADGGSTGCKRLGVLASKTAGYHDLVCDFDTHITWDGVSYKSNSR